MPLYEWRCEACGSAFEALAALWRARRAERCPRCGGKAQRIMSAPVLGIGRARRELGDAGFGAGRRGGEDFPIPPMARLCGMDDQSARRLAAYKAGRGHEYDDRQGALEELRKREGVEPAPKAGNRSGLHAKR
jgi:putative FmdB family regulatory protein